MYSLHYHPGITLTRGEANSSIYSFVLIFAIVGRIFLPANLLDMFLSYTSDGGGFYEKIHPFSYIILILALSKLISGRSCGAGVSSPAVLVSAAAILGLIWTTVSGSGTAVGFLLDSVLVAGAGAYLLLQADPFLKGSVFNCLMYMMLVNSGLIISEWALKWRLLPYAPGLVELQFRPAGLLGHPLNNGLFYATAAPLAMVMHRGVIYRIAVALIFLGSAAIAGARAATVVSGVFVLICTLVLLRKEIQKMELTEFGITTFLVFSTLLLAVFVGAAAGVGERLVSVGLFDESSQTRLDVYRIMNYLTNDEIMFGAGNDRMVYLVKQVINQRTAESPVVGSVFLFGAVFSVIFFTMILLALFRVAKRGDFFIKFSILSFVIVSSTNNVLITKTPALLFVLVLGIAACGMRFRRRISVAARGV